MYEKPVARIIPEGGADLTTVRTAVAGLRELRLKIAARSKTKRCRESRLRMRQASSISGEDSISADAPTASSAGLDLNRMCFQPFDALHIERHSCDPIGDFDLYLVGR